MSLEFKERCRVETQIVIIDNLDNKDRKTKEKQRETGKLQIVEVIKTMLMRETN